MKAINEKDVVIKPGDEFQGQGGAWFTLRGILARPYEGGGAELLVSYRDNPAHVFYSNPERFGLKIVDIFFPSEVALVPLPRRRKK
jgi:hypothetical protein